MSNLKKRLHSILTHLKPTSPGRINHPYAWENVAPELMGLFSEQIDPATKHRFMTAAIAEARQSSLYPTVGAVVVKDGEIVGSGCRRVDKILEAPPHWRVQHAEQIALQRAGTNAQGAILYVTLEPCAARYQGATVEPAEVCSALIPPAGIECVVIGLVDHDPMTCGKGLKRLQAAGIRLEYTYAGLEQDLLELVGDGHFGVLPAHVPFNA
ncbi:MAG: deaminase [Pseudomonadales bacterium]